MRLCGWSVSWLLLCSVFLSACAGDGPATGESSAWFDRLQREVFDRRCVSGPCHNTQFRQGNLILSEGLSYDQLVRVAADNFSARQADLLRVEPFAPEASFLLRKLVQPGIGEGSRMPLDDVPLSAAELELVRSWITDGAPRGGEPTAVPSATPTDSPTVPSRTPTRTATPTWSASPTRVELTATPSPTATPRPTGLATETATRTLTPASPTATPSPTPSETSTATRVDTPTATPVSGSTLAEIQTEIFDVSCALVNCHTDADQRFSGNLSLQAGSSFDELVGVEPDNATARLRGALRVDPGDPDNSFIVTKLSGVPPLGEGSPMPLTGGPLPAEDIERVRAWILGGALP